MQKPGIVENLFSKMGTSANLGIGVMCAIAGFKGIFRPMFTMMDKKSDPETKKYTAMREFLTEVSALPLYAVVPIACSKVSKLIFKNHKSVENIAANTKFVALGVATFMVPVICNKIQPPIMAAYKKRDEAKKLQVVQINSRPVSTFKANCGLKVGG